MVCGHAITLFYGFFTVRKAAVMRNSDFLSTFAAQKATKMKERVFYLIRLYALLLVTFIVQKPLFLWLDSPDGSHYTVGDCANVALNGLLLDVPVTGYIVALPLLLIIVSCWIPRSLPLRNILLPYYFIVALAVSVAFVVDVSLYPFWKFKLDATIFYYIDSPKNAMASVSTLYIICRVVAIIGYGALILWGLLAVTPRRLHPIGSIGRKAVATVLFIAAIGPLVISIRGGLGESTANVGKVYFSSDEYLNHSAVNPCFSMVASLGKAGNYEDEFNFFAEEERAKLFDGLYPITDKDTTSLLTTRRPNIVVILMEGFGGQFIEAVSGRKDIAPNFNSLAKEGIFFTNCYSNSFRTDRGTVSALSGYAAFPTLSVMKLPFRSRTLPCVAQSLNAEGYRSSFLYGGDINFTNMKSYLRTGGYEEIVSDVDFAINERKDNPWGANDDVTFNRLYNMIMAQKHSPWHIGYLTLSSHEPFKVPYRRLSEDIPNAFAFTDHCLGQFINRIKKTPEWENLLIVCIPDHGFPYPHDITYEGHHHNTMLWLGGAVKKPLVVDILMNQSDMPATLLGQLGINHSAYTLSRDVLSPQYNYPFAFFTAKENFGFIDSTGYTVYDIISSKVLENSDIVPQQMELRLNKAKAIMQSFYDDLGNR